jgi:hypothetical protein
MDLQALLQEEDEALSDMEEEPTASTNRREAEAPGGARGQKSDENNRLLGNRITPYGDRKDLSHGVSDQDDFKLDAEDGELVEEREVHNSTTGGEKVASEKGDQLPPRVTTKVRRSV